MQTPGADEARAARRDADTHDELAQIPRRRLVVWSVIGLLVLAGLVLYVVFARRVTPLLR